MSLTNDMLYYTPEEEELLRSLIPTFYTQDNESETSESEDDEKPKGERKPKASDYITCDICQKSFRYDYKAKHNKTKYHRVAEAKKAGLFDYEQNKIISPIDIAQRKSKMFGFKSNVDVEENKIGNEGESSTNFPKTPVLKPAPDPKIKSFSLI